MTYNVVKRPATERDIEECFVHIAEDALDIGIEFLIAVETSLERLAEFPLIGKAKTFPND
jgi:plasmid stabilization system protein ParE